MQLSFNNSYLKKYDRYEKVLNYITKKAFAELKLKGNYVIEVNLVNDKTIKKINYKYRNLNKPTDVLSFAFLELKKDEVKIKGNLPFMLGEVIISIDQVKKHIKSNKHSEQYELVYLYVHGLLHLLGYDHVHSQEEKKRMFKLEDQILFKEKL